MDINTFAQIIAFIKANGGGGGGGGGTATAGVTSFNGRRNAVYPRAGDYNATMIMTSSAGISVQEALDNLAFTSTPDGALLPSSTNPVQNRVLYAAINDLKARSVPTGGAAGSVLVKVDGTNFNTQWVSTNGFMMKSTYDPDNDGVVQAAETAKVLQGPLYQATLRPMTSNTMVVTDLDKGIANGVAPLDGGAQIPIQHIPGGVMLKSQYDPDNDGKVEKAVSAELLQGPVFKAALKPLSGNTNVLTEEDRGAANGVAPLDAGSKIPATHLPNDAMLKAQYDPNNDGSVTMADAAKAVQGTAYRATLKPLNGNTTLITEQEKGASLGVAPLDSNNRVPVQHMPTGAMLKSEYDPDNNGKVTIAEASDAVQGPTYKATLKNTSADTTLLTEEDKGIANGIVPLDSTGKILPQYLPDNIMNGLTNGGIFNATTRVVTLSDAAKSILQVTSDTLTLENTPTVPAGYPANVELYYITTVGGTFANMDFVSGDWLISLGNQWQQLKNGNQVSSVNGKTGAVQLISDEVPQGTSNLYLTPPLKAKLDGIENEATKDLNVIQDAVIVPQADGTSILKLTNKNGTVTNLQVAGVIYTQEEKAKLAAIEDEATKDTLVLQTATVLAQSDGTNILRLTNKDGTVTDLQVAGTLYTAEERAKLSGIEYEATKDMNVVQEATVQSATTGINTLHLVNKNGTTTDFNASSVYYTQEERTKLDGIQEGATKDLNVIQSAAVVTLSDGTKVLRLVNKNGETTEFQGGGASDLSEYLKQTGNAGSTYVMYTPTGTRQSFNGNETLQLFFSKVTGWLQSAEQIAFTGEWSDIKNAPTKLSEFINDGNGITAQPFITNSASDLYNYYKKAETYTKAEVDALIDAISGFNFIVAQQLPTTNIDTKAIYYIPVDPADQTKGYNRYQRIGNQWVFLGTTDLDMTNFLTVNGDGSLLTVQYTPTANRQYLANGETLASAFGKITTWINDLKAICFDGRWQTLENSDELATKADLERYVGKEWPLTEA